MYMTITQVCAKYGIPYTTLWSALSLGHIPNGSGTIIGRWRMFDEQQVAEIKKWHDERHLRTRSRKFTADEKAEIRRQLRGDK